MKKRSKSPFWPRTPAAWFTAIVYLVALINLGIIVWFSDVLSPLITDH